MNFAIECCCNRKTARKHEMTDLKKRACSDNVNYLSDIYELVMTPCESTTDLPETPPTQCEISKTTPNEKKTDIYVNFFEEPVTPNTPRTLTPITPRTPDVNENMINLTIPRGRNLYVNYEKFNFT